MSNSYKIDTIPLALNQSDDIKQIVFVKAAVRFNDVVYTGWRHFQIINWMKETGHPKVKQDDQGFVDSNGYFYRRAAAKCVAIMNGQVDPQWDGNELTSEDLWDINGIPKKD